MGGIKYTNGRGWSPPLTAERLMTPATIIAVGICLRYGGSALSAVA
jgi:hypothetical protein